MSVGKKYFKISLTELQSKVGTKHCIKAACYAIVLMLHNVPQPYAGCFSQLALRVVLAECAGLLREASFKS